MKITNLVAAITVLAAGAAWPALAADDRLVLPDICTAGAGGMMGQAAGNMPMVMAPDDDAHRALNAGMAAMNSQMMEGMTVKDIDVAFICGMMPHHQGAIDMAKAELQYGDDPWAKQLAQKIIDAQTAEIAQMQDWLKKQPRH